MLLGDQKNHEKVCIQKYQSYASQAQDSQLKQLFNQFAQQEQQHLDTLNQIMSGQVPNMSQGQQSGQNQQSSMQSSSQSSSSMQSAQSGMQSSSQSSTGMQSSSQSASGNQQSGTTSQSAISMQDQVFASGSSTGSQKDASLCNDMLMTEKYVSGAYDTAIFEFADANIRQALNHIQKEEQQHGEKIFNYMQSNGMYNVQQ